MKDTLKTVLWFGLSIVWVFFAAFIIGSYGQGLTKKKKRPAFFVPKVFSDFSKDPLDIWSIYIIMEE